MASRNGKLCLGFVLICILISFCTLRDVSCRGIDDRPPGGISNLVEVSTPLKIKVDGVDIFFRAEEAEEKQGARETPYKTPAGKDIKITPIMNLDVFAFDPRTQRRINVAELFSKFKKIPPINVHIKLSSSERSLFFWEPRVGGGEWVPAKSYIGKDITNWRKHNRDIKFTIVSWPEDDRQTGSG